MPLSFVIFGAISAIAVPYVDPGYDVVANLLLLLNLLILVFGIYLGITHQGEPFWVTLCSILLGVLSVLFYALVKYRWVQEQQAHDMTIFPQLY